VVPIGQLVNLATSQLLPFISSADDANGKLVAEALPPQKLERVFDLALPTGEGRGASGLEEAMRKVLKYSVNTWKDGFMDKLYASTDPCGVASDLLLSVLNTNVCHTVF
jgi:glutamate decarboxylase